MRVLCIKASRQWKRQRLSKDDAASTDKKDEATSKKPAANTTTEAASSSNMPKTGDAGSMMPLVGSAIASLGAIVTGVRRKFRK